MKLFTKTLSLITIASLALLASCGGDGGGSSAPEKDHLNKLSKTWVLGTATLDGDPSTQIESNFSITFSGTYDSENPEGPYEFVVTGTAFPSPMPPDGDWLFGSEPDGNEGIILLGDLPVSYTLQSNGDLKLTFTCSACSYDAARANSAAEVNGDWEFNLVEE